MDRHFSAVIGGCTASSPSAEATATGNAAADRIFRPFDTGSYGDFSANFSATMSRGTNEGRFNGFQSAILGKYGKYVSRSGHRPLPRTGKRFYIPV